MQLQVGLLKQCFLKLFWLYFGFYYASPSVLKIINNSPFSFFPSCGGNSAWWFFLFWGFCISIWALCSKKPQFRPPCENGLIFFWNSVSLFPVITRLHYYSPSSTKWGSPTWWIFNFNWFLFVLCICLILIYLKYTWGQFTKSYTKKFRKPLLFSSGFLNFALVSSFV